MDKTINALGLMSGTSMDGVDASIIKSDGENNIEIIGDLYQKYDPELKKSLINFSKKINSLEDLKANEKEYKNLERIITLKHSEISENICKKYSAKIKIVGFHGQTILHRPKQNYSIQMGNAKLLSQLLKKDIISQFRKNDLENGGEGAPLTPIYHHLLKSKLNFKKPVIFLNLGGIANYTFSKGNKFYAKDVGPGNCLMDSYIKQTKNLDYDDEGKIANSGQVDNVLINNIFEHEIYNAQKKHSYDVKDFDINFVKGLSLENALANLNYFTAKVIAENIKNDFNEDFVVVLSGGGRKNKTLILNLKKILKNNIYNIDDFNINGDFVESQAFAYLSIRSLYKKNISFPETTNVKKSISGGELTKFI